jgi:hypothetical protein
MIQIACENDGLEHLVAQTILQELERFAQLEAVARADINNDNDQRSARLEQRKNLIWQEFTVRNGCTI